MTMPVLQIGQTSIPYTVRYSDRNGQTPLHYASQVNPPEAAND